MFVILNTKTTMSLYKVNIHTIHYCDYDALNTSSSDDLVTDTANTCHVLVLQLIDTGLPLQAYLGWIRIFNRLELL